MIIKAIENIDTTCMKCLCEFDKLNVYELVGRGYGSSFDNISSKIQLCDSCDNKEIKVWFSEQLPPSEEWENYKLEDEILAFVNKLPIQGRELFENTFAFGAGAWNLDAQVWIDIELKVASDEVYEENGMYSPRQIKAYEERFPTCEYPVHIKYSENSIGCTCPFGAYGDYGQKTDVNISEECFNCDLYKVRENPIKEMDKNTYKKYEKYMQGRQFNHLFEEEN